MAQNETSELEELRSRMDWLDQERRKSNRKLAELEQQITLQQREVNTRDQRIRELEQKLATTTSQINRLSQVDTQLAQFKDDIVQMIEQYDQRRLQAEKEMDRLRRIEQEGTAREIADIRKELPAIPRLAQSMELRVTEESRLANLIGVQQNKLSALDNQVDTWERAIAFVEEKEKQNTRSIGEAQTELLEINKKWGPIYDRLDALASNIARVENTHQAIVDAQGEIRDSTKDWMEQIQIGEYERNQRLEKWRLALDDQQDIIERFNKEWIKFNDQYKEAKMAVQTLSGWQEQIEQQQRESSEVLRVESHRMHSRWDDFQLEIEKKIRTFTVDVDQRWANINRMERQVQEQITVLEDMLKKLQDEKDTMRRIQSAQADAIKQWPRIWLEEVEKAVAQNPNRRRQPALVPTPDETI